MKRLLSALLSVFMLMSLCSAPAFAAEENDISKFELPAPKAPNYFVYTDGDAKQGHHDDLRMIMVADPDVALLAMEYDRDSDAFREKYGLWSFEICMQYDVSLDNEESWQYTSEWDSQYSVGSYGEGFQSVSLRSKLMESFEFFWLTYYEGEESETFVPYKPAILAEKFTGDGYEQDVYSFDVENHSLYIRCRYYMEWETFDAEKNEIGAKQSKFSDWSQSAVFGKNGTQVVPEEPTVYEAPVISDLKIVLSEGDENSHLEYAQITPESVWMANAYYIIEGEGQFDGLESEVSINGGEWIEFDTVNSWGDWCLYNGNRGAFNEEVPIDENTNVKLRVRFAGTHGPSEWSNVLEVNGGGTQENPVNTGEPADEKPHTDGKEACSLCGFCPMPLGLCIFIWIAIAVVIILIIVLATKKKKKK